ncbi:MAG TPA: hypothetical protein VFR09_02260 [Alphaproteobacteria bacterium]|nr:hypothetical protein [Alphaproteobacteria bacterium]
MPHPSQRGRKKVFVFERKPESAQPPKRERVPGVYYPDVPKLGSVAVSRHAQDRMAEFNISLERFERVLLDPLKEDIREAAGILWRERDGLRLVILERPEPFRGAKLVKSIFRIQNQAKPV